MLHVVFVLGLEKNLGIGLETKSIGLEKVLVLVSKKNLVYITGTRVWWQVVHFMLINMCTLKYFVP